MQVRKFVCRCDWDRLGRARSRPSPCRPQLFDIQSRRIKERGVKHDCKTSLFPWMRVQPTSGDKSYGVLKKEEFLYVLPAV